MAIALIKQALRTSIAESIFDNISSRNTRLYHYVGQVVEWVDEQDPPTPRDSIIYERDVRRNIIYVKEIKPSDIAFVINRIDWSSNTVYDSYDDAYSSGVIGIDLIQGGNNYSNVSITLTSVTGSGATANATVVNNVITSINLVTSGSGYNVAPTITITDPTGSGAIANAKINIASSGANTLEDSNFFVVTNDFNVYKCLDNNNGSNSTVKPTSTSVDKFTLSDGYTWKFMYNVPYSLRNKFATSEYIPVINAVKTPFYSNGEIKKLTILSSGNNYTGGTITVTGDGYLESDPVYITGVTLGSGGDGYLSNTTANISPPFAFTSTWAASSNVVIGDKIFFENNIYEVVKEGQTGNQGPSHTGGIALNGLSALKFIGTKATGNVSRSGNTITGLTLDGSLKRIIVDSGGTGYSKVPSVTITGGGGSNAYAYATVSSNSVNKIYINQIGSGFTTPPSVIIGTQWQANANATLLDQVFYSDRLYTVSGLNSNAVSTLNVLSNVTLTLTGNGYSTAVRSNTVATISTSGTTQPTTNAAVSPLYETNSQTLIGFTVTSAGAGYTTASINNTFLTVSTVGTLQPTVNAIGNLNFIDSSTIANTSACVMFGYSAPVHTSGTVASGTANLTYSGQVANAYTSLKYGAGYFNKPTITFQGSGSNATANIEIVKTEAIINPIFTSSRLTGFEIEDGGIGYTYASAILSGDGTGATIIPNLSTGDLLSLNATNELLADNGAIDRIEVLSGGYGYTTATVEVKGSGSGANVSANIVGGRINSFQINDPGAGYTYAEIVVTGDGKGASGRVILPPTGGHGKDSIKELYASDIMMVTNVTDELNQGYNVNNDYRQFGLIKDIKEYNQAKFFTGSYGSACWGVSGNVNTSLFTVDKKIKRVYDETDYIIIASDSSGLLLQSVQDQEIISGQNFREPNGNLFLAGNVVYPDVDKYSGSLLFIDNRKAFIPIDNQIVTLRTILKF